MIMIMIDNDNDNNVVGEGAGEGKPSIGYRNMTQLLFSKPSLQAHYTTRLEGAFILCAWLLLSDFLFTPG